MCGELIRTVGNDLSPHIHRLRLLQPGEDDPAIHAVGEEYGNRDVRTDRVGEGEYHPWRDLQQCTGREIAMGEGPEGMPEDILTGDHGNQEAGAREGEGPVQADGTSTCGTDQDNSKADAGTDRKGTHEAAITKSERSGNSRQFKEKQEATRAADPRGCY